MRTPEHDLRDRLEDAKRRGDNAAASKIRAEIARRFPRPTALDVEACGEPGVVGGAGVASYHR
jgi:hypothetical protein